MKVRANAETPLDARTARSFGAEGIGLCRTEHMFFEGERIVAMREMILAEDEEGRRKALAKLCRCSASDFAELFEIMSGLPVTIRLLDPPLHEFLPHTDAEIAEVSKAMGVPAEKLRARANELHEFNPMLGFRGVPPGGALSRNRRDAGARDPRRRGRSRAQDRHVRPSSRSWCPSTWAAASSTSSRRSSTRSPSGRKRRPASKCPIRSAR